MSNALSMMGVSNILSQPKMWRNRCSWALHDKLSTYQCTNALIELSSNMAYIVMDHAH